MKIAIFTDKFPKLSETFILSQITGLIDLGIDVEICALTNPLEKIIHNDYKKYRLKEKTHYAGMPKNLFIRVLKGILLFIINFFSDPVKIIQSLNFFKYKYDALSLRLFYTFLMFRKKEYDIIHCHFGQNGILISNLKSMGMNIKFFTVFHGWDMSSIFRVLGENIYDRLFNNGDKFLPVSDFWKKVLIKKGCPEEKILVHHMGINPDDFTFKERNENPDKTTTILTVGRLTEKKGHEYSIRAIAKCLKNGKKIRYIIAGDGPLRKSLEDLVSKCGISDSVEFTGSLEKDKILKMYMDSDLFVLSSITTDIGETEGLPMVIMEAMATGIPVVSTYHTGIPEIIKDGVSGYLVNEKDVKSLSKKIMKLISSPGDQALFGKNGRDIVLNDFNINKLNRKLEKILKAEIKK